MMGVFFWHTIWKVAVYKINLDIMETKKTEKANIEKLRFPIASIGLLFIGSMVLATLSFTKGVNKDLRTKAAESSVEIEFLLETAPKVIPPTPPEVKFTPPVTEKIIEEKSTKKIPDPRIILPPPHNPLGPDTVVIIPPIIDFPDVEATFMGGAVAMQKWIAENVQYPQGAIEMNEQGKVYLSFVVESDGSISNITVERGVSSDLDKEAKRLVRQMPNWVPGEAKGKKARTRCRLPINFTLN